MNDLSSVQYGKVEIHADQLINMANLSVPIIVVVFFVVVFFVVVSSRRRHRRPSSSPSRPDVVVVVRRRRCRQFNSIRRGL